MSSQSSKPVKYGAITTNMVFEDFESLVVIGLNDETLTLEDEDGGTMTWPTGTPFAIGGAGPKLVSYTKVTSADASYALYQ